MKKSKVHFLAIIITFAAVLAVVSFGSRSGRGQTQRPKTESPVKPTILITNRTNSTSAKAPSPFLAAVERNGILKHELTWTFGGKQQRGWYLYDLLIRQALDTESEPETSDFAAAIAAWQKKMGLTPSGMLDEDTFMTMVSHWQSKRLKNRAYAEPDQLVTPSPSEFFDPSRVAELRQVERNTYDAYRQMIAAAIADPTLKLETAAGELAPTEKFFKIISSFRSREYQERLRRQSPNAGSAGLAINSPHFTGRALDIYVGGDPVDTRDANRAIQVNTPAYKWLVRNAAKFGFRPYFYEPWHWEYVK
jgi:zinc D-Ala-D-Ala carboxypeptidase